MTDRPAPPISPWRQLPGLLLLAGLVVPPGSLARAEDQALSTILDLPVRQLLTYEGLSSSSESTLAGAPRKIDLPTRASLLFTGAESPRERRLLMTRSVTPTANGLPLPAYSHVGLFHVGEKLEVGPLEAPPPSKQLEVLERHLPASILPQGSLPEGNRANREETILVCGTTATAAVQTTVSRQGDQLTITRVLAQPGKVEFGLDEAVFTVQSWKEVFVVDAKKKQLIEATRQFQALGERNGSSLTFDQVSNLKLTEARLLQGDEGKRAEDLEREVSGILSDFTSRKHPREIYQHMLPVLEGGDAKLVPGLVEGLQARLAQYRQDLELERRLAGKPRDVEAPDFTLEGLDGKPVAFREATRGKVVLLSFWGYGCGPCRAEAPYLSKLQEKYGDKGFVVIAVNGYDEERALVESFVTREKLQQKVLLMGRSVAREKYHVTAFPTTVWIDHKGKVVHTEEGFGVGQFPAMEMRARRMIAAATGAALQTIGR